MAKTIKRKSNQLRPIKITRKFTDYAPGSVLIEMGQTRILCTASIESTVPSWLAGKGKGWLTAEYSMLPSSTLHRKRRSKNGHTDGRGTEIQRLIGRVLRSVVDMKKLGENLISLDCDVLQADGGTRTAAICGAYIALVDAVAFGLKEKLIPENPITQAVAAISVGIIDGKVHLDLDYILDSSADVDMNVAMTSNGEFVELQGTGERTTFSAGELTKMITFAQKGIKEIFKLQKMAQTKRIVKG